MFAHMSCEELPCRPNNDADYWFGLGILYRYALLGRSHDLARGAVWGGEGLSHGPNHGAEKEEATVEIRRAKVGILEGSLRGRGTISLETLGPKVCPDFFLQHLLQKYNKNKLWDEQKKAQK